MKLLFNTAVAAFLLFSVIAERNGPSNTRLSSRSKFNEGTKGLQVRRRTSKDEIIITENENSMKRRRIPSVLKITRVSKSPRRTIRKKFLVPPVPGIGFNAKNFADSRSKESRVRMIARRSFAPKLTQAPRRSLDLGIDFDHISESELNHDAIFLEPVIHHKRKKKFLGYSFDFGTDSDSLPKLGPVIGPLDFPGLGGNVFIRLMVPPDEETSSHVTVHLVNNSPFQKFHLHREIYESPEFPHGDNPKSFTTGEELKNFEAIKAASKLITPELLNSRKSRFVGKLANNFRFVSSKMQETLDSLRTLNLHHKNLQEYVAAPNHHELPIVNRRYKNNLIDLPIYPPLSNVDDVKNTGNKETQDSNTEGRLDDAQESESSKRILVSEDRNFDVNSQTGNSKSINILAFSEPLVTYNRKESPQPVFIEVIPAPDLGIYNASTITKNSTIPSYSASEKKSHDTAEDEEEDEFFSDYYSEQITTTSRPNFAISHQNISLNKNLTVVDRRSTTPLNVSNNTKKTD